MFDERGDQTVVVDGTAGATVVHSLALQRCHVAPDRAQDRVPRTDVPLLDASRVHVRMHRPLHDLEGFVA